MKLKVYVAGSISETEYRRTVMFKYSNEFNLFEPLNEIETKVLGVNPGEKLAEEHIWTFTKEEIDLIVEGDKAGLESCDVVTVYMTKYSAGSIMEIMHAWNNNIPVYIIDPSETFRKDVWISYHSSKFFDNIDECFAYLKQISK